MKISWRKKRGKDMHKGGKTSQAQPPKKAPTSAEKAS